MIINQVNNDQVDNETNENEQDANDKPVKHENLEYFPRSSKGLKDQPEIKQEHMEYLPRSSEDLNDQSDQIKHEPMEYLPSSSKDSKDKPKKIKVRKIKREPMEYLSRSIKDEEDEQAVKDTDEVLECMMEYRSPKSKPPDTPKAEPIEPKRQKIDDPGDDLQDRKCLICDVTVRGDLTTHYVVQHLGMDLALYCEECDQEFYTFEQKLKHQKIVHHGVYPCPHCEISCTIIYAYIEHLLEDHLGLVFKCKPCDEIKHSPDALIKHKKTKKHRENTKENEKAGCKNGGCYETFLFSFQNFCLHSK